MSTSTQWRTEHEDGPVTVKARRRSGRGNLVEIAGYHEAGTHPVQCVQALAIRSPRPGVEFHLIDQQGWERKLELAAMCGEETRTLIATLQVAQQIAEGER